MAKPMTWGNKIKEVEREMGVVKMILKEMGEQVGLVMNQVNSIQDSLKILPELVA